MGLLDSWRARRRNSEANENAEVPGNGTLWADPVAAQGAADRALKAEATKAWGKEVARRANAVEADCQPGPGASDALAAWLTDVSVQRAGSRPDTHRKRRTPALQGAIPESPSPPPPRMVRDASEAEEHATDWVRHLGWPDAQRTQASGDAGLDVLARSNGGVGAQVKFEALPAGRPVLQQLAGACLGAGVSQSIFFASAGFTPQATAFADGIGMALFRFAINGDVRAFNQPAQRVVAERWRSMQPTVPVAFSSRPARTESPRQPKLTATELDYLKTVTLVDFCLCCARIPERRTREILEALEMDGGGPMIAVRHDELVELRSRLLWSKPEDYVWGSSVTRNLRAMMRADRSQANGPA